MAKILIIHGPNLNLLGMREPHIYGNESLEQINADLTENGNSLHHQIECFQSNSEHQLLECIHQAFAKKFDFIILNAGAFTHTSIALRDALLAVNIPFIEVHISNIFARDKIRHHSYFADIAIGVICGFGTQSYELALTAANHYLAKK